MHSRLHDVTLQYVKIVLYYAVVNVLNFIILSRVRLDSAFCCTKSDVELTWTRYFTIF